MNKISYNKPAVSALTVKEALKIAEQHPATYPSNYWDYNRAKALTMFAQYIEDFAKQNNKHFALLRTKVGRLHIIKDRVKDKNKTGLFNQLTNFYDEDETENLITDCFGIWFSCVYDDKYFYFSIDDNPFFDHYVDFQKIVNGTYNRQGGLRKWTELGDCSNYYERGSYDVLLDKMINSFHKMLEDLSYTNATCGIREGLEQQIFYQW